MTTTHEEETNMFVVAIGDAFNGLTLYGPFETEEAAENWAEAQEYKLDPSASTVVLVQEPQHPPRDPK